MAHQSFSKTVLEKLTEEVTEHGEVSTDRLSHALHLQTYKDHKRMLNALSDLGKSGRIERVRQGVYGLPKTTKPPAKREVMWRVLRMRRAVTVADLQELADVSKEYAKEWLALLIKHNIVKRFATAGNNTPHTYRLINDQTEVPVDTDKAEKLRKLRKKKQQALKALDDLDKASTRARKAINDLEE